MLDLRIYRAAFIPLLVAIVLVAFSLQPRARPIATTLSPEAFDVTRTAQLLTGMAEDYPDRRPGSAGDAALARKVETDFRAAGFEVRTDDFTGRTIDGRRTLRTVVAERPGRLERRIVVLAHRDAAARGSKAELSGTAALLELARLFSGRTTRRTLTLVSTSGGSGGAAGAAHWAEHVGGPVDAVIVLGDLAGTRSRRPWVVPWSDGLGVAPLRLSRTVELAVRQEVSAPGAANAAEQLLRLAFPLTVSEQGVVDDHGIPAVLISSSGELGPAPDDPVSEERLQGFGRAALRSLTALDDGPDVTPGEPQNVIVTRGQVVPEWAVRLLVGVLLLPVLLGALDGIFRVRRRGEGPVRWVVWTLASALPFLLAGLILILLRAATVLDAPPAPVPPDVLGLSWAAVIVGAAALALGFVLVRPAIIERAQPAGPPGTPGSAGAVALVTALAVAVVWVRNPYAALFLVPAAHLWLFAVAPEVRVPHVVRLALVVLGLVPLGVVALAYAFTLDAGPLDLLRLSVQMVAGGAIGPFTLLSWSVVAGCAVSAAIVAARVAPPAPRVGGGFEVRSRGPIGYAGPGSVGGTESALR